MSCKTHNYIIKYCNTLRYCIDIIACAKYRDIEQNRFFPPPLAEHTHTHSHSRTKMFSYTHTRTHTHTHAHTHTNTHTHTHTKKLKDITPNPGHELLSSTLPRLVSSQ